MDVGAAIRQQMLGVLIDAIGRTGASHPAESPLTVSALSAASPAGSRPGGLLQQSASPALAHLPAGTQVAARMVEWKPDGAAIVTIGDTLVRASISGQALPAEARQPGALLLLRVETAGETPRLTLLQARAPGDASASPTCAAPHMPSMASGDAGDAGARNPSAALLRAGPAALLEGTDHAAAAARPGAVSPALSAVVQATSATAAARQGSAAPLFAELARLVEQPAPDLPPAVAATARTLVEGRLDGERPIAPEALKAAIQRAAVPAEALVARGAPEVPDVKTMIVALRSLLALAERRSPETAAPDVEPPRREGGPAAVRPALPSLEPDADARTIAQVLLRESDQAVERSRLHQIASLPDARPAEQARQHLSFDLPVALGAQTAMAGFRIEREKRPSKGAQAGPIDSWGVRFAIDADGLGPVHAHLRLTGSAVSVSLWAEDAVTRQRFLEALPTLEAALSENALDIGELAILGGRPVDPKPQAGLFLNRTS